MSGNARSWWRRNEPIGGAAADAAEAFAGAVVAGAAEADPVSARYQGGTFCAAGYDRDGFGPDEVFGWRGVDRRD